MLGIFSWFGYVMPIWDRLDMIKKAGFDCVTVWWEDEEGYIGGKKEDFSNIVKSHGLFIENIHAPSSSPNLLWSEDNSKREKELYNYLRLIEDCARFDIPMMVMHPVEGENYPAPNKYGLLSFEKIARKAKEYGVIVSIENTTGESNLPFIFKNIESKNIGLCYDTSHDWLHPKRIAIVKNLGDKICTTHISDNDGLKDRHWIPGEGDILWSKIGESFPKKSYTGCVTLEIFQDIKNTNETPQEFLNRAYKAAISIKDYFTKA